MTNNKRKEINKKDRLEIREETLRPSPSLGYGRDKLAMHLIKHEAYDFAEPQLRRAIWLNPFEPAFKQHLAWCLYKQKRFAEARIWVKKAIEQEPNEINNQQMLEVIEKALARGQEC
jgi:Flp pilus assembly protein TadD